MTDFVIVVAPVAGLMAPAGGPAPPDPAETVSTAPLSAPLAASRTYRDEVSCEQAAAALAVAAGRRVVCLPIEDLSGESGRPY